MKQYVFVLFLLLASTVCAQQEDGRLRDIYQQAEEAYSIGRFDSSIHLLDTHLNEFQGTLKVSAYRLLSLCYLSQDKTESAEQYANLLLKEDPYYSVTIYDPLRFSDMIERLKRGESATITTASQQAESIEEAPVPVTLITKEMIEISGARTLKEALITFVPGMTDVESNEETNIAMRGIYSSGQEKILIMLNGHRLNSYSTNTARQDFSISLDKVKQIEVLRGPASSLYGGVALTAVVNIITLSGHDIDGAKLKVGAGNHGQFKGSFLFGKQYLDWKLMGWASVYNASGEKVEVPVDEQLGVIPVPGSIIIGGFNRKPSFDVGLDLSWKNFRLLYNTNYSKTVAPYSMSYFFAPYSYKKYRTFQGNAPGFASLAHHLETSIEKTWNNFHFKAIMNVDIENQNRYQVAGDSIPDYLNYILFPVATNDTLLLTNGVFQNHNWQETTWGIVLQGNYQYVLNNRNKGTISVGIQRDCFHLKDSYYVEGDHYNRVLVTFDESKNLYTGKEINANAYFQIKHQWDDWLILNLGLRYDYKKRRNQQILHEYSPRVAFILVQPKWNLKFSYAKSFVDAPYFYRNNTLDTTTGGESLLSEYLHSYQCSFIANHLIPNLEFDINLFYNRATDFIVPDRLNYTNAGALENIGTELSAAYTYKKFKSWFNLTWQHVLSYDKYNVKGKSVYNVPSVASNIVASYELLKNFYVNTHLNIYSRQTSLYETMDSQGSVLSKDLEVPARAIWNFGLKYCHDKYEINFNAHNLLNKSYEQGGTSIAPIQQQGFWFDISLAYKF